MRSHGYPVVIDMMHGRSILEDEQLLPVLRLLIERGAGRQKVAVRDVIKSEI